MSGESDLTITLTYKKESHTPLDGTMNLSADFSGVMTNFFFLLKITFAEYAVCFSLMVMCVILSTGKVNKNIV